MLFRRVLNFASSHRLGVGSVSASCRPLVGYPPCPCCGCLFDVDGRDPDPRRSQATGAYGHASGRHRVRTRKWMPRRAGKRNSSSAPPAPASWPACFALAGDTRGRICSAMLALRSPTDVIIRKIRGSVDHEGQTSIGCLYSANRHASDQPIADPA
jgi:hypothetical protein